MAHTPQKNLEVVQGLIATANATTGEVDATLTDAVGRLVEGYGQGGEQDFSIEDGLISRTLTGVYRNDRITRIGKSALRECNRITELIVPNVTLIDSYGCAFCGVKQFDLSSLTYINQQGLANIRCDKLVLPKIETIFVQAFLGASIKQLVITNTEICTLNNVSAFQGSSITIYVPDNLVESYKTATNWSTFADQIKPISELPTEEE